MAYDWRKQKAFRDKIMDEDILDRAIAWIKDNLAPEDVFPAAALRAWAEERGMVDESEGELV